MTNSGVGLSSVQSSVGLGVIRWWTGNIRATTVLHYLSDATFFLTTYG